MTFYNKSEAAGYGQAIGAVLSFKSMITELEVKFLAYLESINQTFNSTWNAEQVYGRNDDIATFQGTKRSYNISWTVPAENAEEAEINLKKCGSLVQLLYPQYNTDRQSISQANAPKFISQNALSISKPPLIRLKFANLIVNSQDNDLGLLGYITNLSWTPNIEAGMFAQNQNLFPKVITISIDYNVLHEHQLGYSTEVAGKDFGGAIGFPFKGS